MKSSELKVIPKKNYLILGIILIISFLLLYYISMWSFEYKETKLNIPILDKYMEVINYNELDNYLVEMPDTIIYVSVLENSEIREFEKKFKNVIKKDLLKNDVLYMNITDEINNKDIKSVMDNKYIKNLIKMSDVPSIIVFENGNIKSIYSIKDNDYDIDNIVMFINNIKFNSEDDIND